MSLAGEGSANLPVHGILRALRRAATRCRFAVPPHFARSRYRGCRSFHRIDAIYGERYTVENLRTVRATIHRRRCNPARRGSTSRALGATRATC